MIFFFWNIKNNIFYNLNITKNTNLNALLEKINLLLANV